MAATLIAGFDLAQKGAMVLVLRSGAYGKHILTERRYVEWDNRSLSRGEVYLDFLEKAEDFVLHADVVAYEEVRASLRNSTIPGFVAILKLLAFKHHRMIYPVNVSTIKKDVAGHGHASKEAVRVVVRERVERVPGTASEDHHDALAVAVWVADHMEVMEVDDAG